MVNCKFQMAKFRQPLIRGHLLLIMCLGEFGFRNNDLVVLLELNILLPRFLGTVIDKSIYRKRCLLSVKPVTMIIGSLLTHNFASLNVIGMAEDKLLAHFTWNSVKIMTSTN